MSRRIKLWTGLGAFVLAGTGGADVPELAAERAEARPLTSASSLAAGGSPLILAQGGEQGEAGERGEAGEAGEMGERGEAGEAGDAGEAGEAGEAGHAAGDLSDPAVFAANLLMMHGHLTAAAELAAAGEAEMATPHLSHPLEGHYGALEGALAIHGVEGFEDELDAVASLDAASDELPGAIAAAQQRIMAALETLPPEARLAALEPLVHVLAEEYEEGVADGRVVNLEEYQDAWGFLQAARALVQSLPSGVAGEADVVEIEAALDKLGEALPAPVPPESGLAEAGRVKAAASEIELITSAL